VAPRDLALSCPSPRGKKNSRGAPRLRQIDRGNLSLTQVRPDVTGSAHAVAAQPAPGCGCIAPFPGRAHLLPCSSLPYATPAPFPRLIGAPWWFRCIPVPRINRQARINRNIFQRRPDPSVPSGATPTATRLTRVPGSLQMAAECGRLTQTDEPTSAAARRR
jgi:hypothetical protein